MRDHEEVLTFWFGTLDERGLADEAHVRTWWRKDLAFDEACRARFASVHEEVLSGRCEGWLETARGRLAYVIVLDQFSRNMFRDTPRMFASDARALAAAKDGVDRRQDRELALDPRSFLYMPFMHSEALADQDRCVALFEALRDEVAEPERARVAGSVSFAEKHRVIIERFGRFPHRNAILGRASTPEEIEFLKGPGSSF